MFGVKKFLISLLIAIALNGNILNSALAITQDFQWASSKGYLVKGVFDYDEITASEIIAETGKGKTQQLKSLQLSFYNPHGTLIHTYNNVVDRIAQGDYFEFNFDTKTQQFVGNLDLGGEIAGDVYIKGKVDGKLNLIEIESGDRERILDSFNK